MHSAHSQYVKANASQEDTKSIRMGAESNHTNKLTDSRRGWGVSVLGVTVKLLMCRKKGGVHFFVQPIA